MRVIDYDDPLGVLSAPRRARPSPLRRRAAPEARAWLANVRFGQLEKGEARRLAEIHAVPARTLAWTDSVSDPTRNIYPGRMVFHPDDVSLYVISFRPSSKGKILLYEIEGPEAGNWKEIPLSDLANYQVVTQDEGFVIRNLTVGVIPKLSDVDVRLRVDYVPTILSNALIILELEFPELKAVAKAVPERMQLLSAAAAAVALTSEAIDMAAAAFDALYIGKRAYSILAHVATRISMPLISIMSMLMKEGDAAIPRVAREVDGIRPYFPLYGQLIAQAFMWAQYNATANATYLGTDAQVVVNQASQMIGYIRTHKDELARHGISPESADEAERFLSTFVSRYTKAKEDYFRELDKALKAENTDAMSLFVSSRALPYLIRVNAQGLSEMEGAKTVPKEFLSGAVETATAMVAPDPTRARQMKLVRDFMKLSEVQIRKYAALPPKEGEPIAILIRKAMATEFPNLLAAMSAALRHVNTAAAAIGPPPEWGSSVTAERVITELEIERDRLAEIGTPQRVAEVDEAISLLRTQAVRLAPNLAENTRILRGHIRAFMKEVDEPTLRIRKLLENAHMLLFNIEGFYRTFFRREEVVDALVSYLSVYQELFKIKRVGLSIMVSEIIKTANPGIEAKAIRDIMDSLVKNLDVRIVRLNDTIRTEKDPGQKSLQENMRRNLVDVRNALKGSYNWAHFEEAVKLVEQKLAAGESPATAAAAGPTPEERVVVSDQVIEIASLLGLDPIPEMAPVRQSVQEAASEAVNMLSGKGVTPPPPGAPPAPPTAPERFPVIWLPPTPDAARGFLRRLMDRLRIIRDGFIRFITFRWLKERAHQGATVTAIPIDIQAMGQRRNALARFFGWFVQTKLRATVAVLSTIAAIAGIMGLVFWTGSEDQLDWTPVTPPAPIPSEVPMRGKDLPWIALAIVGGILAYYLIRRFIGPRKPTPVPKTMVQKPPTPRPAPAVLPQPG